MRLHPSPEPTVPILVKRYVDMPRCPVENADGTQCKRSLSTGSPMDILIDGRNVTVCRVHGMTTRKDAR